MTPNPPDPLHPFCFCRRLHISEFGYLQTHGSLLDCGDGDANDAVKLKMQRQITMIETFIVCFLNS